MFLTSDAAAMTALRAREMVARDLATRGCVPSEVAWSVEHGQVGEVIGRDDLEINYACRRKHKQQDSNNSTAHLAYDST